MDDRAEASEDAVVLIVEDERDLAETYAGALEEDHEVITAYGGEEALEKVHQRVDIVLLDRRMPGRHGDDVLGQLREREDIDCRIVMVTAVDPSPEVVSLDFDDYLVKPVTEETLQDAVRRMLARNVLDDHLLDAFALASKMAKLESKMDPEALEGSEEYAELEARFNEYRELFSQIDPEDNLYAELSATKMEALFAQN